MLRMDPPRPSERCVVTNCLDPRGPPLFNSQQVRELTCPKTSDRRHEQPRRHDKAANRSTESIAANRTSLDFSKAEKVESKKKGFAEEKLDTIAILATEREPIVGSSSSFLRSSSTTTMERERTAEAILNDASDRERFVTAGASAARKAGATSSIHDVARVVSNEREGRKNSKREVPGISSTIFHTILLVAVTLLLVATVTLCWTFGKGKVLELESYFYSNQTVPFSGWRDGMRSIRSSSFCWKGRMRAIEKRWWDGTSILPDIRRLCEKGRRHVSIVSSHIQNFYSNSTKSIRGYYPYSFKANFLSPVFSSVWRELIFASCRYFNALSQFAKRSYGFLTYALNSIKLVYRKAVAGIGRCAHSLSHVWQMELLKNTAFITWKNNFFFWSRTTGTRKELKGQHGLSSSLNIPNGKNIASAHSHDSSASSQTTVIIKRNPFFNDSSLSTTNNISSRVTLERRCGRFVRYFSHSFHFLWSSFISCPFRVFFDFIHALVRWVHSFFQAAIPRLLRLFSLRWFTRSPPSTPLAHIPEIERKVTGSSTRTEEEKWWSGWGRRDIHRFLSHPWHMAWQQCITLHHGIQACIWQCRSRLEKAIRSVTLSIQQKFLFFWDIVRTRKNPSSLVRESNISITKGKDNSSNLTDSISHAAFSNGSFDNWSSHRLAFMRQNHFFSVGPRVFYFVQSNETNGEDTSNSDAAGTTLRMEKRESMLFSVTKRLQKEIAKELSLNSSADLKHFIAETGIFIEFTVSEGLSPHLSSSDTQRNSFQESSLQQHWGPNGATLYNSPAPGYPKMRFAPSLYYRLNHSIDLLEAMKPLISEQNMKTEEKKKDEKQDLQKAMDAKELVINTSTKGSVENPEHWEEEKWKLERELLIASNEKCQKDREAMLEKVEGGQSFCCNDKAKKGMEMALRRETVQKEEQLCLTLIQDCDERLMKVNTSLHTQWNKTSTEHCSSSCAKLLEEEKQRQNEIFTAFLTEQRGQTKALQGKLHQMEEETINLHSICDNALDHMRSCVSINHSVPEALGHPSWVPAPAVDEDTGKEVMLAFLEAIETRCAVACQTRRQALPEKNGKASMKETSSPCERKITSLRERLRAQLEKVFSSSSVPEDSPSLKEAAFTFLSPESLGNDCTLWWREELEPEVGTYGREGTSKSSSLLIWYRWVLDFFRMIGVRVFWLTVTAGVLGLARGFYYLWEENARLRCELQQANIIAIQEKMMNMEGMCGSLYTPPQRIRDDRREPFTFSETIEVIEQRRTSASSESEKTEKQEQPFFLSGSGAATPFLFFSSLVEVLFGYLADCHFQQCELLWSRVQDWDKEGATSAMMQSSPSTGIKLSFTVPVRTLEGKKDISSGVINPLYRAGSLPQVVEHLEREEKDAAHTRLIAALLKGYLQAVENHYLDILDAAVPPELGVGSEIHKRDATDGNSYYATGVGSSQVPRITMQEDKERGMKGTGEEAPYGGGHNSVMNSIHNSSNGSAEDARLASAGEATVRITTSRERPFLCCYKWRLEAEHTKHLMEMQAETIRQLEQDLEEALHSSAQIRSKKD